MELSSAGCSSNRWGWDALDDRWARHIVAVAAIEAGDLVLDIGAGTGALTAPLVEAGAGVIAVELHQRRVDILRRRFADAQVTVVRADAADSPHQAMGRHVRRQARTDRPRTCVQSRAAGGIGCAPNPAARVGSSVRTWLASGSSPARASGSASDAGATAAR